MARCKYDACVVGACEDPGEDEHYDEGADSLSEKFVSVLCVYSPDQIVLSKIVGANVDQNSNPQAPIGVLIGHIWLQRY